MSASTFLNATSDLGIVEQRIISQVDRSEPLPASKVFFWNLVGGPDEKYSIPL